MADLGPTNAAQARARMSLTEDRIRRRREQLDAGPQSEPGFFRRWLGAPASTPDRGRLEREIVELEAELAVLREFAQALPEPEPTAAPVQGDAVAEALQWVDAARETFKLAIPAAHDVERAQRHARASRKSHRRVSLVRTAETQLERLNGQLRGIRSDLEKALELLEEGEARQAIGEVAMGLTSAEMDPGAAARALPDLEQTLREAGRMLHRTLVAAPDQLEGWWNDRRRRAGYRSFRR